MTWLERGIVWGGSLLYLLAVCGMIIDYVERRRRPQVPHRPLAKVLHFRRMP